MKCPKCNADNPEKNKFCSNCGTSLTPIPATLTSPPPEKEGAPEKSPLDFAPGQYFGKRYQIIEEIGRGGMGRVYKALDKELNRTVALKMIKPELSSHPGIVERFKKEIKLTSQIKHENVCRIHDLGEVEGIKYISMEFIEGHNLHEFIQSSKGLKIDTAINIAEQMCQALTAAHKKGVIHRDLKPQNIMIDKKGNAYVMDFGIARSLEAEEVTKPGVIIGTPHYMSPEQAEGKAIDTRSDIYSLGCILYEMLTGQPPFEADTSAALIYKHLKERPRPPSKLNPHIAKSLEMITLKCLEKKPDSRYPSAQELQSDLESLRASIPLKVAKRQRRLAARWLLLSAGILVAAMVLIIGLNVGGLRQRLFGRIKPGQINSVAVLPLENLSGDPEQEYFADGMTDALISNLAKIKAFHRVISRTSVMQYKGVKKPLPEIAQELKVDAVVEGTVLRSGELVRITVQLIEARTDRHLWVESYERDLSDILSLQSEVARAIASEIKIAVTPEEEKRLTSTHEVNPEAYEAFLKGHFYFDLKGHFYFDKVTTREGDRKAMEYAQKAIEKDPNFAPAYSLLAWCYIGRVFVVGSAPKMAYPRAKEEVMKALEIDETLDVAHMLLAFIKGGYDWDWSGAEREYKRAIELNPGNALNHSSYSFFLSTIGRHEEAIAEAKKAEKIDPISLGESMNVGRVLCGARRYDDAIEQLKKTIEMDPNYWFAYYVLGYNYEQKGMYQEAIAAHQKAIDLSGGGQVLSKPLLGYLYAISGQRDEALKILNEWKELEKQRYMPPIGIALLYLGLGEKEQALNWLEKAYDVRDGEIIVLKVWATWDPLRSDPRFQAVIKRMNFPEN